MRKDMDIIGEVRGQSGYHVCPLVSSSVGGSVRAYKRITEEFGSGMRFDTSIRVSWRTGEILLCRTIYVVRLMICYLRLT